MGSKGKPENAKNYGISLATEEQKAMWKKVSARETAPSRYPHDFPLQTLGIMEDFWKLCDVGDGNGLVYMFQRKWPSFRKYTLEFLSSLKVTKDRRQNFPLSIDFRLGNRWHSLTMEELSGIFHCFDPNPEEDNEYEFSEVWGAMTNEQEHAAGYAKSSSIRNPVLRYLHRAMTQLMFARIDGGSVSQTELNVMWCLLNKKGIDYGTLFTYYVDRITKKDGGVICCGGLITAIGEHLGVSFAGMTEDGGEKFITYEVLFSVGLLKTDHWGQGYFMQVAGDHFPVPLPQLTKVDVWANQANWKLDTPAHRRAIEANPVNGEFRKRNIPSRIPQFEPDEDSAFDAIDNYEEGAEHSQAQGNEAPPPPQSQPRREEEEEEEEVEGHRRRTRANRRRGRPNPEEEFQVNTSAQLGEIFSYMQNMSNAWDNRWAEQQAENAYNRQGWTAQGDWRTAEQEFWEQQRLEDVHRRQQYEELRRMAAEAREERETMRSDITYLVGAFEDLSARFPPPPQD